MNDPKHNNTQRHVSPGSGPGRRLAQFLAEGRPEEIPDHIRHEAVRAVLHYFGTALGGSRDVEIERGLKVLDGFSGPRNGTLIGRRERVDVPTAAFINGMSSNVLDFDDTHLPTVIHPSAPLASALFACAEQRSVSGRDLVHAFVMGIEAECRIGLALGPGHYRRGWHITSTCGVFGAAAGCGVLLGLDTRQMVWALGCAATQSAGMVETFGFMAKTLNPGGAARNGLLSALLAANDFNGPPNPLDGDYGYLMLAGDEPQLVELDDQLGQRWELERNNLKAHACGVVLQPVVDCCLDLRAQHGLTLDRLKRVEVRGHPLVRQRTDRAIIESGREAQLSLHHTVGAAFKYGSAGLQQYQDACVKEPDLLAFRGRVTVEDDAGIPVEGAIVTVYTTTGEKHSAQVDAARGSSAQPLTDVEIETKVRSLAANSAPDVDPEPLISRVWAIDNEADVSQLLALAVPRSG